MLRDREDKKTYLNQSAYIDKIVTKYGVEEGKTPKFPLSTDKLQQNEETATPSQIHQYRSLIGSILYAAIITRPDIAYAASKLSQFLENPSPLHIEKAYSLIKYLNSTKDQSLTYSGSDDSIIAMSDASFADNVDRKSSQGFLIKMHGAAIHYKSTKQDTVTTSSTEAELLALAQVTKEVYATRRILAELGYSPHTEVTIKCDNAQTIRLLTQETVQLITKLRHVDIHRHWLRQEVQRQRIKIEWIPTAEMIADGLTKPLTGSKLTLFQKNLGLEKSPAHLQKTHIN